MCLLVTSQRSMSPHVFAPLFRLAFFEAGCKLFSPSYHPIDLNDKIQIHTTTNISIEYIDLTVLFRGIITAHCVWVLVFTLLLFNKYSAAGTCF